MTPEQFYWRNKINSFRKNDIREMRIQSLDWMLGCYRKGTIRRRTIINLIPLGNLYSLLHELEEEERYENCAIIKTVIDEIYEQVEIELHAQRILMYHTILIFSIVIGAFFSFIIWCRKKQKKRTR